MLRKLKKKQIEIKNRPQETVLIKVALLKKSSILSFQLTNLM